MVCLLSDRRADGTTDFREVDPGLFDKDDTSSRGQFVVPTLQLPIGQPSGDLVALFAGCPRLSIRSKMVC